jgi:hypothetical protein
MIERGERLRQFGWPTMNTALLATAMRWLIVILFVAGVIWLIGLLQQRRARLVERTIDQPANSDMANAPELVIHSTANPKAR